MHSPLCWWGLPKPSGSQTVPIQHNLLVWNFPGTVPGPSIQVIILTKSSDSGYNFSDVNDVTLMSSLFGRKMDRAVFFSCSFIFNICCHFKRSAMSRVSLAVAGGSVIFLGLSYLDKRICGNKNKGSKEAIFVPVIDMSFAHKSRIKNKIIFEYIRQSSQLTVDSTLKCCDTYSRNVICRELRSSSWQHRTREFQCVSRIDKCRGRYTSEYPWTKRHWC